MKDGAYAINLDDKNSKGTQWVLLFIDSDLALCFDSFETYSCVSITQNQR